MKKAKKLEVLLDAAEKWQEQLTYMISQGCSKGEEKSYRKQLKKLEVVLTEGFQLPERPKGPYGYTAHWQQGDLVEFRRLDGTYLWGVVERVEIAGSLRDQLIVMQPGSKAPFVWVAARCRLLRRNGAPSQYVPTGLTN